MCKFFAVSRSGYYAFIHRLGKPEKDAALAEVIAQQQKRSFRTYGYRRMWLWLKRQNIFYNPKTVLRVMKKYDLLSEIRRRRKWQQMGQQLHKYKNLLNREFHADGPNSKWVTDISYIHTKQGVLYLSMIRDLYDNSIVACKTGTEQTVNLVLDTIRLAMKQEKKKKPECCCIRAFYGGDGGNRTRVRKEVHESISGCSLSTTFPLCQAGKQADTLVAS